MCWGIAYVLLGFLATAAHAQPKISPVLECVTDNRDGTYTAHFGYNNTGSEAEVPVGPDNAFSPSPQDRGQPSTFQSGRQVKVFSVDFNGGKLVWTLASNGTARTATASDNPSQRCVPEVDGANISPILECVAEEEDGTLTARFGYENHYGQSVRVPPGPNNKITPQSFDGRQPLVFEMPNLYDGRPGRTPFDIGAFRVPFDPGRVDNIVWTLGDRTATASAGSKRCPCEASDFSEEVNREERRVEVTVGDPNGIGALNFRGADGTPLLENLSVELVTPETGISRVDSGSDLDWEADDPNRPPTKVRMHLHQVDRSDPEVAYFLIAKNRCGTDTVIDPVYTFASEEAGKTALKGNAPNPFSKSTRIAFTLPDRSHVTVGVYDIMGRKVKTLLDRPLSGGLHEVRWKGRGENGYKMSSGVYLYRLETDTFQDVRRMTLVR